MIQEDIRNGGRCRIALTLLGPLGQTMFKSVNFLIPQFYGPIDFLLLILVLVGFPSLVI